MLQKFLLVCALVAASLALGRQTAPTFDPIRTTQPSTCVIGTFVVDTEYGMIVLGDIELCGTDLKFSDIHGPSKLPAPTQRENQRALEGGQSL